MTPGIPYRTLLYSFIGPSKNSLSNASNTFRIQSCPMSQAMSRPMCPHPGFTLLWCVSFISFGSWAEVSTATLKPSVVKHVLRKRGPPVCRFPIQWLILPQAAAFKTSNLEKRTDNTMASLRFVLSILKKHRHWNSEEVLGKISVGWLAPSPSPSPSLAPTKSPQGQSSEFQQCGIKS